ncbi:MAG TPA: putative peptidoglycan glycosyltransferase FtsW [Burkholderiales bacterium]|nr:putative peptidoglycan glycosyltransferase FtsW [Burkholderiales bacterium]
MRAYRRLTFDIPLFLAVLGLVAIGIVMVFSSSGYMAEETHHQMAYFLIQQVSGAAAGLLIIIILLGVKKPFYLYPVFIFGFLAVSGLLLTLCLAMPSVAHTNRWVFLPGFRFQPSELAKLSLILFLAWFSETRKDRLNDWKVLAVPLGILVVAVLLILMEPDFGTALVVSGLACLMLYIGGVKLRNFAVLGAAFAVVFTLFLFSASYRVSRLQGFLSPAKDTLGSYYQVDQSKIAVGAGGTIGVGLGQSTQKLYFLPSAHTDFIYAIIGEETGLAGTLVVLALFFVILWRGVRIAVAAADPAHKMVAAGITFVLVAQALMNISIVLGLGPTKGIPLPFVSYGRSSLLCSLAAAGLLLHISQKRGQSGLKVRI